MTDARPSAPVSLPHDASRQGEGQPLIAAPTSAAGRAWRVVVVDDSPDDRAEVRRLLLRGSGRRYAWTEAEVGAAAIRAVLDPEAGPPDCVILDYNLPDMDADGVLAALAGPDGLPACPVVVLTGSEGHEHNRALLRAGAQDYLGKGWMTPESLTRAVENAVERWAMARDLRDRESALRASEERFRFSIEASPTAVVMVDRHGAMIMVNPELERLSGYGRGEMLGRPVELLLADGFREGHAVARRDYFREPTARRMGGGRELALRRRDGTLVDVEIALSPGFPVGDGMCVLGVITDITQRKRAEVAAQKSEERLELALAGGDLGVWDWDVATGAVRYDDRWAGMLGYSAAEVVGEYWFWEDRIHPDDRTEVLAALEAHFSGRSADYRVEHQLRHRSGGWVWVLSRGRAVERDPSGRPIRACGTHMDITARKEAEAAVLDRQRQLQMVADNTPDILTRFDRGLRHVFVSAAVLKATGRPPEDFLGKTNRELGMPDAQCDEWDALMRSVFETGRPRSLEFAYEAPGGERHYSARFVPEVGPGGDVEFILGVTHDVTDRRCAEAAVRAGEERLKMALTAARAGAWAWEVPTGAITWSPENYFLYGVDPDSGPPSYRTWEERIHPEDLDRANAAVRDALEGRTQEFRSEFRVVHPVEGLRWLLGLGRVEFGPAGEPIRMGGINLDITDRKHFEQGLADQDRRKDEFLATLAHELRNPLAPIRTGLEVMRLAPPDDPTVGETREMMERQLAHMVRLVDDLLDVSRISHGKVELRRERLQLRAVIDQAVEVSSPLLVSAGHELILPAPGEVVWLDGDFTRLAQVVSNVLNNAAKYTPDGGRITLSTGVEGDVAVIRVADNGGGIPAEMLPKVFDLFAQVDRTLGQAQGGLGIGLSLVRKLLEMHGGTISAESPGVGLGSTFTVRLPLADPPMARIIPATAPADGLAPTPFNRPPLRALVVDDNKDAARLLARLLKLSGHSTRIALDGPEAIEVASTFRPDLIILDIGLPGMDGYEVCRRLRSDPDGAPATLVALTGWGTDEDKKRAHDAGFAFHLVKPVHPDQIATILEAADRTRNRSAIGPEA